MDCMKGVFHNLFYRSGNSGLVRPFWIFVLISLYVVFFGINTFKRFTKESIIVIKENLDVSSTDINPGEIFVYLLNTTIIGMAILPIDPIIGKGWKSSDASNLLNATGDELRVFDPTFAMVAGNPVTFPRSLIYIPHSAGYIYVYLRVSQNVT